MPIYQISPIDLVEYVQGIYARTDYIKKKATLNNVFRHETIKNFVCALSDKQPFDKQTIRDVIGGSYICSGVSQYFSYVVIILLSTLISSSFLQFPKCLFHTFIYWFLSKKYEAKYNESMNPFVDSLLFCCIEAMIVLIVRFKSYKKVDRALFRSIPKLFLQNLTERITMLNVRRFLFFLTDNYLIKYKIVGFLHKGVEMMTQLRNKFSSQHY